MDVTYHVINVTYHVIEVEARKQYLSFEDCPFRLVLEDGKYVGWYYCGEREGNEID